MRLLYHEDMLGKVCDMHKGMVFHAPLMRTLSWFLVVEKPSSCHKGALYERTT